MSGQHEQDRLGSYDQSDPREATLDFSRLLERVQQAEVERPGTADSRGANGSSFPYLSPANGESAADADGSADGDSPANGTGPARGSSPAHWGAGPNGSARAGGGTRGRHSSSAYPNGNGSRGPQSPWLADRPEAPVSVPDGPPRSSTRSVPVPASPPPEAPQTSARPATEALSPPAEAPRRSTRPAPAPVSTPAEARPARAEAPQASSQPAVAPVSMPAEAPQASAQPTSSPPVGPPARPPAEMPHAGTQLAAEPVIPPAEMPRAEPQPTAAPVSQPAEAPQDSTSPAAPEPLEAPPETVAALRPQVKPEPGSRADLKVRLENLPFGHPSSPYHGDGQRKPSPPRLKHLELAPPGPERTAGALSSAGGVRFGEPDSDAVNDTFAPQDMPLGHEAPAVPDAPASADPLAAYAAPTTAATSAGADDADSDSTSTMPAVTGTLTANTPGTAPGLERAQPMPAPPDRRPPPPQPQIAADGSWTWGPARLTRDQVRIAEDAHDRFRAAEGLNPFGSYHDDGLTARMRDVEQELLHGTLAPGTVEQALLPPDRFKARLADMLRRHPERHAEQLALRVPGALSYSFVFGPEHYADGIWLVQDALEVRGFELQARRNAWNSSANRCVYTIWRDPLSDLPVEVQFHTTDSLEAQHLARTSATLINDPRIPAAEAEGLKSDIATTWAALPAPPGNSEIGDYRRASGPATPDPVRRTVPRHDRSTP